MWFDLSMAEHKRRKSDSNMRRQVVSIRALAPKMTGPEIAQYLGVSVEAVNGVLIELDRSNGKGVRSWRP